MTDTTIDWAWLAETNDVALSSMYSCVLSRVDDGDIFTALPRNMLGRRCGNPDCTNVATEHVHYWRIVIDNDGNPWGWCRLHWPPEKHGPVFPRWLYRTPLIRRPARWLSTRIVTGRNKQLLAQWGQP